MEKQLGKITFAEFGYVRDYPFLMGLQLTFEIKSNGVSCDYTVNVGKECKWKNEMEKITAFVEAFDKVVEILKAAKVNYVSELVGIPVEVTLERNWFKEFRVLTEVL